MTDDIKYIISLQDKISSQLKTIQGNTDNMNKSIDKTKGLLTNLGIVAGAVFVAKKVWDYGKSIVDLGAKFEAYEIGLGTLLHGTKEAHEAFEQIKKDAATTPFDTESLLQANRALISAGASAKEARKVTLDLGNAIAATGGGSNELGRMAVNLQQIKNVGKASALDIKQFAFAGINVYGLLAKSTGKSIAQVKDMEVSYSMLTKALKDAAGAGGIYEGGLAKMGKSTQVQLSNIGDTISFLAVDIFKMMKPLIDKGLGIFNDIMGRIKENLPAIVSALKPVYDIVKEITVYLFRIGKDLVPLIKPVFSLILTLIKEIWTNIKYIIDPIVDNLKPAIELISEWFGVISSIVKKISHDFRPLFILVGRLAGAVFKIAVVFGKIGLAIFQWITHTRVFKAIWDNIVLVLTRVVGFITSIVEGIASLIGMSKGVTKNISTTAAAGENTGLGTDGGDKGGLEGVSPASDAAGKESKPESAKLTNINISIGNLVNEIIFQKTLDQSEGQLKEQIVRILTGAVNGFNVIPGQ